ncbi:TonB-dependent receptor [uncultured Flavobacterium sp.]|uniref:TonB-dependent receptor n=1 Tax=uncultured Flavobacterium sp. TaxID=165435 RepID=UPI001228C8E5|nr:TonB-dependent receptor [uncultured Flavobacterium sp.]THD34003.1 MAG: TonB-dependent receptor [Flavobacterium johnsoniae]
MKNIFTLLFLMLSVANFAQQTISGKVTDEKGRPVTGANVFIEGTYDGDSSDEEGNFSFQTTVTGKQNLVVTFLTFETYNQEIVVEDFKNRTVKLKESVNTLDAVVITAGTFESGDKARTSVLKPLDIVTTAGAAGDIVGALLTLPGAQTVGEDGRLFVRGGEADETQTYVDGLRVSQPYGATTNNLPTRGRFSPFLFSGIAFSTGGYSAEYGEALSSVLLLNTIEDPDQEKTEISLMTVGLGLGNTQKWEKSSLSVNASYANLAPYQAAVPQAVDWNRAYQSISGELVYRYHFNNGTLKTYMAFDAADFDLNQEDINRPEKIRVDVRNNNFYLNSSYKGYFGSNYQLTTGISYGYSQNKIGIALDDVKNAEHATHMKIKIGKNITERIKLTAGADYFTTKFDEDYAQNAGSTFSSGYDNNIAAAYAETNVFFSKRFAAKAGFRFSYTDLLQESNLSPRFSLGYKVSDNGQLSFAYGDFVQSPRQEYLKYSNQFESEKTAHYILNYEYSKTGRIFRAEAYFKQYRDLVKYDTQTVQFDSQFNNNGKGFAKGIDLYWRDNTTFKNLEYWFSYSYIDTERDFKNYPKEVTPSFVADHSFSVVTKYWINSLRSQIGLTHSFNSGRPYNNPNETSFMNGKTKSYNNLSLSWAYLVSQQKILYFSVSNVLGTDNVFGYQYANNPDASGQFQRRAIGQPADRFIFVGFFWTISDNKKDNQLKNL